MLYSNYGRFNSTCGPAHGGEQLNRETTVMIASVADGMRIPSKSYVDTNPHVHPNHVAEPQLTAFVVLAGRTTS